MKMSKTIMLLLGTVVLASSCVSKKKFDASQDSLSASQNEVSQYIMQTGELQAELDACKEASASLQTNYDNSQQTVASKDSEIQSLKTQIQDLRDQRDKQYAQISDLTVLTKSANDNIGKTLGQLEEKEEYIQLLQAAKNKTDSINLALAVNLKSVLADGIADEDINIGIDKTVVFINLSDKMLYRSGSSTLTRRAKEVLGKIAKIVEARPEVDVMVEGYTDNVPINTDCTKDNWDLSVQRATSVVRVLQNNYNVDPNKLIAAGRGEYNALADNSTREGRATNRRTRIIIMPRLNQFYDLLNPETVNINE